MGGVPGAAAALAAAMAAIAGGAAAAVAPTPPVAAHPAGASRVPAGAAPAVTGGRAALEGNHAGFARCMLAAELPPDPGYLVASRSCGTLCLRAWLKAPARWPSR